MLPRYAKYSKVPVFAELLTVSDQFHDSLKNSLFPIKVKFGADSEKDTRRRSISVSSKHMTENDPLH